MQKDDLLRKARKPCPKCGKKGVGYANHPHAFGYKDYDHASCRYCNARFKILATVQSEAK